MTRDAAILGMVLLLMSLSGEAQTQRMNMASIQARLIQASEQGPEGIDPALADIETKLRSTPVRYKQYKLVAKQSVMLSAGKSAKMAFANNTFLEATLYGVNPTRMDVSLRWTRREPDQPAVEYFNTRVNIKPGDTIILGGPSSNGGVLLMAVSGE